MRGIRQHGLGRSLYEECLDGRTALAAAGAPDGRLLSFFPHAARNPYQRMLYARGFDHGFACFPLKAINDVTDLPEDVKLVLHYHWLHRVFDEITDDRAAQKAVDHFLDKISRQRAMGHTILWTVHNVMSHAGLFPEQERDLRSQMAELADIIHIMNPHTVDLCREIYRLDERKIMSVPHPSYRGVYGDYLCRHQARFNLDLQDDDLVFLLFGSLGPHKGTRQFLGAFDNLQARLGGRARVLVAGVPGKPAFMEQILELAAARSEIQLFQTHVDDQAVQVFFKAADVVVCPYPVGLNSGVMVTAAGFGRPVVVPDMMAGACAGLEDCMQSFRAGDIDDCLDACERAVTMADRTDISSTMDAWAEKHRPEHVSAAFFAALNERLGAGV